MCKEAGERPESTRPQDEINGRHSDATLEKLLEENEAIRLEMERLAAMIEDIKSSLFGKDGNGGGIISQLSNMLSDAHLTSQLQAQVIEAILNKMSLEKILASELKAWQVLQVARMVDEG